MRAATWICCSCAGMWAHYNLDILQLHGNVGIYEDRRSAKVNICTSALSGSQFVRFMEARRGTTRSSKSLKTKYAKAKRKRPSKPSGAPGRTVATPSVKREMRNRRGSMRRCRSLWRMRRRRSRRYLDSPLLYDARKTPRRKMRCR